ncbi:unnamed protein product [Dovyalis caffra]|uniref:Uncharacterized protein n=1 Tax=Dovyalis caffra TaxID=77055 RepID=A0AAV1SQG1_9ROSI|nr:unnamed protein product [Dovyalis caffra]
MATQFVCLTSLQLLKSKNRFTRTATHGERVTKLLSIDQQSSSYRHTNNGVKSENSSGTVDGEEMNMPNKVQKRKRCRRWARELPRYLGLWYASSSISYILRKARAFYNEFCCDNFFDDSLLMGHELLADPYFSFPVIPPPTIAPHHIFGRDKGLGSGYLDFDCTIYFDPGLVAFSVSSVKYLSASDGFCND